MDVRSSGSATGFSRPGSARGRCARRWPIGLIHHPNLTVTVDQIEESVDVLTARGGPPTPA